MKKLIAAFVLLGASNAFGSTIELIEAQYKVCFEKATSTMEYNYCSGVAYDAADRELNSLYKDIRDSLLQADDADSKERLNRLVTSERAWITFRDADCSLKGIDMLGGTGEGVIVLSCQAQSTIDRVKLLESLFM